MSSFSKALMTVKGLLTSTAFLAPILATFGVVIPPVAIAAIAPTIALMDAAERSLGDGTGPLKKEAVTAGMVAFSDVMKTTSTGGQKETWERTTPEVVSVIVDAIATTANMIAKTANSEPVFDDSMYEAMKYGR